MGYLMEAEELGCGILAIRAEILELHKRANESREAASELRKTGHDSAYMYEGALLVRNTREEILKRLGDRQKQLQDEIKAKGEVMKRMVYRLQDLEMQVPYSGKDLMPLDKDELKALSQVWGMSS